MAECVPYLGHTIRRWQIGRSTFLAWPEAGARLMHWSITRGDGSVRDVIYWPELAECSREEFAKVRGGNPLLFPFCGRTFDRGDIHFWRGADGVRRPMPMHGIARQGNFRLIDLHEHGFEAVLEPDAAAREAYPFEYAFKVSYRFSGLGLSCEFALANLGTEPMPWSAGHHFYFNVPWQDELGRRDYHLRLRADRHARQHAAGGLADAPAPTASPSLADPSLLDTLHLKLRENACTFGPRDGSERVTVKHGTERKPHPDATFVTWTSADDAPYYCVEPWMGPPNAPEHRVGLHRVHPGQTARFSVEVLVQ